MRYWSSALDRYCTGIFTAVHWYFHFLTLQIQRERDDLYKRFVSAIHEVQQKSGFKNLLLEKKLTALADTLEKKVSYCKS